MSHGQMASLLCKVLSHPLTPLYFTDSLVIFKVVLRNSPEGLSQPFFGYFFELIFIGVLVPDHFQSNVFHLLSQLTLTFEHFNHKRHLTQWKNQSRVNT